MRGTTRALVLALLAATSATQARAGPPSWITVRAPNSCEAAGELAARVSATLVAEPSSDLLAFVTIEREGPAYRVTIETTRHATSLGKKVLGAATCEEAVGAAVVVLALALSGSGASRTASPAEGLEFDENAKKEASSSEDSSSVVVVEEPFHSRRARSSRADRGVRRGPVSDDDRSALRVSLATGIDAGTLPMPTVQVGAGVTVTFKRVELRGVGRYGLPYEEEELDTGRHEQHRRAFGAFDLSACYALGERFSVAGCAGGEVAVVHNEDRVQDQAGLAVDEAMTPRLAGVVAALLAYRGSGIQPELELSSAVFVAGRHEATPLAALRATAGVAMQF